MTDAEASDLVRLQGHMDPVIREVLRCYAIDAEALLAPGKAVRSVTEARGVCSWLARQLELPLSDSEIGRALRKDAQTVRKGARRIAKQRLRDRWLRDTTNELLRRLSPEPLQESQS